MRFKNEKCPKCGGPPDMIFEEYLARTPIEQIEGEHGEFDFTGGTAIDYEEGAPVQDEQGNVKVGCGKCNEVWSTVFDDEASELQQEIDHIDSNMF